MRVCREMRLDMGRQVRLVYTSKDESTDAPHHRLTRARGPMVKPRTKHRFYGSAKIGAKEMPNGDVRITIDLKRRNMDAVTRALLGMVMEVGRASSDDLRAMAKEMG